MGEEGNAVLVLRLAADAYVSGYTDGANPYAYVIQDLRAKYGPNELIEKMAAALNRRASA